MAHGDRRQPLSHVRRAKPWWLRAHRLEHDFHEIGEYTTISNGRSFTCAIDITHRLDRAANTLRMSGTACGHPIDIVRPAIVM